MKNALKTVPAGLAVLALGAHFYRGGSSIAVGGCLLLFVLLFVPRPSLRALTRTLVALSASVWLVTAWVIRGQRLAEGKPWVRMFVILGAVAAFALFAAWLLPRAPHAGRDELVR